MKHPVSMKKNSEQITQSFFPTLLNLEGEIPFRGGGRFVTPTICMIKFCQARSALGCILKKNILKKRFLNLIWPNVAFMVLGVSLHLKVKATSSNPRKLGP
jgi:hypothetical protein